MEHSAQFDLGVVQRIEAEALGVPGQRTFRILLQGGSVTACLWLEKEQLQALALGIEQVLLQLPKARRGEPADDQPAEGSWPSSPDIEFKIGQLALGYDESRDLIVLLVHELEADPEGPATLHLKATRNLMERFSHQAQKVCAAGRPRCPLCGEPIDASGHVCIRANGHGRAGESA